MGMALDEPREGDQQIERGGLVFLMSVVDRQLITQTGGLLIDYIASSVRSGFRLSSLRRYDLGACELPA